MSKHERNIYIEKIDTSYISEAPTPFAMQSHVLPLQSVLYCVTFNKHWRNVNNNFQRHF